MIRRLAVRVVAIALLAPAACGDEAADPCVAVDPTCLPLYEPTFDNVFDRTLGRTCSPTGGVCHASDGARGGLVYEDPDVAYDLLLGLEDGRARIVPGDPACSPLVARLESSGADAMPPGMPLDEAERCAIQLWIANGAAR